MLRKALHIALLITISANLFGQNALNFHSDYEKKVLTDFINNTDIPSTLELQLIVDRNINEFEAKNALNNYNSLLTTLKSKKETTKSEATFLSWMFYKVHRKALKNYNQYVTLAETLNNGNYDCLTATSLYAQLLTDLGFKPEVIETTYHIYLKVFSNGQPILFESTDPINGFIVGEREIAERTREYAQEENNLSNYYSFNNKFNESLELIKLTGLQYFNIAVFAYNSKHLIETVDLLEKASIFYQSDRITEFGIVLANAISNDSEISSEEKNQSLHRVADFIKVGNTLASR